MRRGLFADIMKGDALNSHSSVSSLFRTKSLTCSSSCKRSIGISFRAILPKIVSSTGLAVWALITSSALDFFAAQSEMIDAENEYASSSGTHTKVTTRNKRRHSCDGPWLPTLNLTDCGERTSLPEVFSTRRID